MDAEDFFERWSKRNAEAAGQKRDAHAGQPVPVEDAPPPTLEDVAALTPDADFKPFVARGVDESVRRSAMKKLFSDPHFNVMDGLDVYIDDYNKFEPLTPAMLAMMNHAQALLDPLSQIENPLVRLIEKAVDDKETASAPPSQVQADATDREQDSDDDKV